MSRRRTVYVCGGSSCRKALRKDGKLLALLEREDVSVESVRCQKVCESPVVGVAIDGNLEWFERVRSDKALHALSELLRRDVLSKPLAKRRVAKRAGKLRD
ncbi:MAG: (2Fe-2S) ferredoxin domain-containing protein [Sandaracinaceae bacterium]